MMSVRKTGPKLSSAVIRGILCMTSPFNSDETLGFILAYNVSQVDLLRRFQTARAKSPQDSHLARPTCQKPSGGRLLAELLRALRERQVPAAAGALT